MKQEIADIINDYTTPGITVEVASTDRFGCEQIEIRNKIGGRLVWRAWDYEPDFEYHLHRELAYAQIPY